MTSLNQKFLRWILFSIPYFIALAPISAQENNAVITQIDSLLIVAETIKRSDSDQSILAAN